MKPRKHVTEIFATLQGEGYHSGTPAVFVRLAACNLWSGRDADRERDALRHGAACPRFCDTDFSPRLQLSSAEIAARVLACAAEAGMGTPPLVVFTGGEPLLQLDGELCDAVLQAAQAAGGDAPRMAIETNGTVPLAAELQGRLWVCVSPKLAPEALRLREGDELKVVYPAYDPERYARGLGPFRHYFVQPEATQHPRSTQAAVRYCLAHPRWRLSLQTHKILDIP